MSEHVLIKCNVKLQKNKAGSSIKVKALKGVPLDRYWRRRLLDAQVDNCCEIVKQHTENQKARKAGKKEE